MKLCKDCKHWDAPKNTDNHPYGWCKKVEYSLCPVYGESKNYSALAVRSEKSLCGFDGRGWES